MPRGGYASSTRRWSPEDAVKLLELIQRHKHRWKQIQQEMPDRTIHQLRLKWLRLRRTWRDHASSHTGRTQRCKHCGEALVGHICTVHMNKVDVERANDIRRVSQENYQFKRAPSHTHSARTTGSLQWKPTPPSGKNETYQDFNMLIEYITSSSVPSQPSKPSKSSKSSTSSSRSLFSRQCGRGRRRTKPGRSRSDR